MPIDLIHFETDYYPAFQAEGNAAQFALPFAVKVCKGVGVDVGAGKWPFPGAIVIDPEVTNSPEVDATHFPKNLPLESLDFVFSSHCLEHLPDWVGVLDYWTTYLKPGGVLFLYLPDFSQRYWRPWNNRKHVNILTPEILREYLWSRQFQRVYISGVDLNASFMVMGEKKPT